MDENIYFGGKKTRLERFRNFEPKPKGGPQASLALPKGGPQGKLKNFKKCLKPSQTERNHLKLFF